jgi:hypothetical protein
MKIATTALLALVVLAGVAAAAEPVPVLMSRPVTKTVQAILDTADPGFGSAAVVRHYDSWTNPPSALTGVFLAGTDEIADDLAMTPVGAGLLSTMGINVANSNAPSNLTGGQVAVRFYDGGGTFINGFLANLPVVALAAGGSLRLSFAAGSLQGLGIYIPQNNYVSLQWTAATFSGAGSMANLGFQTRGPIGIGSSTDQFINVTLGSAFNFGGNPVANTGLFIDTEDGNPTPANTSTWGGLKSLYR